MTNPSFAALPYLGREFSKSFNCLDLVSEVYYCEYGIVLEDISEFESISLGQHMAGDIFVFHGWSPVQGVHVGIATDSSNMILNMRARTNSELTNVFDFPLLGFVLKDIYRGSL